MGEGVETSLTSTPGVPYASLLVTTRVVVFVFVVLFFVVVVVGGGRVLRSY